MNKIEKINLITPDGFADMSYKETWREVQKINELIELVNIQQEEIKELKDTVYKLLERTYNPGYQ